jgi:transglutaminase-like putative cysteine protease
LPDLPALNVIPMHLRIRHRTDYLYSARVALGPHRLMLRPREGIGCRLRSFGLMVEPAAQIAWTEDVFGNAIATASFEGSADRLTVESVAEVEILAERWPVFPIAVSAQTWPFRHGDAEWADLGHLTRPCYRDEDGGLARWAQAFVAARTTDTLSLLKDLCNGVSLYVGYETRDEEGTQSPVDTLGRGVGSCRDFATLFVEAARTLGFGARIVSGYYHDPEGVLAGSGGDGTTHAWAEVYLPGAGWIAFDPTNRAVGGYNLVPVAVARDIAETVPVAGHFGGSGVTSTMKVTVEVTQLG